MQVSHFLYYLYYLVIIVNFYYVFMLIYRKRKRPSLQEGRNHLLMFLIY